MKQKLTKQLRKPKTRPDCFIAIPFAHKTRCRQAVDHLQATLIEKYPHLKGTLVDPNTIHITLGVMRIGKDQEMIQQVEEALKKSVKSVQGSVALQPVEFSGIQSFRKSVLYMKPTEDSEKMLRDIYHCVRPHFESIAPSIDGETDADTSSTTPDSQAMDEEEASSSTESSMVSTAREARQDSIWIDSGHFTPHMTIAKCSLLKGSVRNWWTYKFDSIADDMLVLPEQMVGESIALDRLQVCSMHGRKKGEYYKIIAQESFYDGNS